jgi:cadmium resistance protein CadD (predicted permease)
MIADFNFIPGAIFVFAVTNLDDIVLLSLFFAGQNSREILRVVAGQYLGFSALLVLSGCIRLAGAVVPVRWIALLGLLPVYLGVKGYVTLWKSRKSEKTPRAVSPERSLLKVAGITIANGADNLAVYGPIFAAADWHRTLAISTVFYVMLAVWCFLAWMVIKQPWLSRIVRGRVHLIVPAALILIGLVILVGVFKVP